MQTHTGRRRDKTYPYYRCTRKSKDDSLKCGTYINAAALEAEVWEAVSRLLDDKEYALRKMEEHFAQRRKELSRPGADPVKLANKLQRIEAKRVRYQQAYAADAMSLADLAARTAELDNEHEALQRELERVMHRQEELERLAEEEAEIRRRIEGGHYDLENMTPEKRRELYQDSRLRVEVGEDKCPHISGLFPLRVGVVRGTFWRTSEQRGHLLTREPIMTTGSSQRHVGSLTGPIDPLTRIVGSGACPERAA